MVLYVVTATDATSASVDASIVAVMRELGLVATDIAQHAQTSKEKATAYRDEC